MFVLSWILEIWESLKNPGIAIGVGGLLNDTARGKKRFLLRIEKYPEHTTGTMFEQKQIK